MIQKWLIETVITFGMRQIWKWRAGINWDLVKLDLAKRVRELVPGEWLDDAAVDLSNQLIDMIAAALMDQKDIEAMVKLLVAGKPDEALKMLLDLIKKHFVPQSKIQMAMVDMLEKECAGMA